MGGQRGPGGGGLKWIMDSEVAVKGQVESGGKGTN